MSSNVIRVVGAREHNLKNITVEIPRDKLVVITGLCPVPANPPWRSIPSSPKASGAMSSRSRPTPASSSARCRNRMWITSKGSPRPSPSTRKAPPTTRVRPSARSPRSTITCACSIARVGIPHCPICGREVVKQSAQEIVDAVEALPEGTRILVLRPGGARPQRHLPGCLRGDPQGRVSSAPAWMGPSTTWMRRSASTATRSTPSRRWWTAWWYPAPGPKRNRKPILTRLTDSVETALKFGEGYLTDLKSPALEE